MTPGGPTRTRPRCQPRRPRASPPPPDDGRGADAAATDYRRPRHRDVGAQESTDDLADRTAPRLRRRDGRATAAATRARARAIFTQITADNPAMSDAWLGRMACGDHDLETLAGAHDYSRALYRETRRIGLNDGELYAQIAAPLYLTVPVWSRATIALAYAAALITAGRYDEAAALLDDPIDHRRHPGRPVAPVHHRRACIHQTRRWPDVRAVTAVSPPAIATYVLEAVTAAVAVAVGGGRGQPRPVPGRPATRRARSAAPTPTWPPISR